jgi:hypothetical protein
MIGIGYMRGQLIKARILRHIVRRHGGSDMADLAEAKQEQPLPDVPLHQRGFGVMDEDAA